MHLRAVVYCMKFAPCEMPWKAMWQTIHSGTGELPDLERTPREI